MKKVLLITLFIIFGFGIVVAYENNTETVIQFERSASISITTPIAEAVNDAASFVLAVPTILILIGQLSFSLQMLSNINIGQFVSFCISAVLKRKTLKKNLWGMVLDSNTFKPIPFVVIHVHDSKSEQILQTTVTDLEGRYGLLSEKGSYYLNVQHQDYSFKYLGKGKKYSLDQDFYKGEIFEPLAITNISFNILMDPIDYKLGLNLNFLKLIWEKFIRLGKLFQNFYFISLIFFFNLVLLFFFPENLIYLVLSILYGFLMCVFIYALLFKQRPRTWGTVREEGTNKLLTNVFLKLFLKKEQTMIDTKVTDSKGVYQFFVPNGKYELISHASGYETDIREAHISDKTLVQDIILIKSAKFPKTKKSRFGH